MARLRSYQAALKWVEERQLQENVLAKLVFELDSGTVSSVFPGEEKGMDFPDMFPDETACDLKEDVWP